MSGNIRRYIKPLFKIIASLLAAVLVVVLVYVSYVYLSYTRIEDNIPLTPVGDSADAAANLGQEYTIVTQNLGFGAYTADYTFFMDGGTESRAKSEESVKECIAAAIAKVSSQNPDIILFQEADTDSTRSFHINQQELLKEAFPLYSSASAENYHSAYLFYPILEPHGASNSGIMTFSRFGITSAVRRSLPISDSFSKFLDLDRCYSVSRVYINESAELVIYNVHSSAYGGSDEIRTAQMTMLLNDMKAEYEKGNYCIAGGDFNHDFTGTSTKDLNGGEDVQFGWAQPFPQKLIPKGISRCISYNGGKVLPTCRNCDVPYKEGNFTIIVDGFLVSDNVKVTSLENIQTGFTYSDHNPVVMKFVLE